jgi:hypothetical protein
MKKLLFITIFFVIFNLSFAQTTPIDETYIRQILDLLQKLIKEEKTSTIALVEAPRHEIKVPQTKVQQTLLISPSINLPKGVKPALPPQVLSQIQQQEQLLLSQPAQDQQLPLPQPSVSGSIRSIIEEILPDENRDDDDIVQINNLRITNFFPFGNDKGVIFAVRNIGWKCMFFESEEAEKSVPCPLGIRKSILGRELVILIKYNDTILLQRNKQRAKLVEFQVGDKINVYGFIDRGNNGIDALIVRNLDLPRRNIGKPTVISPNGGEEWQLGSYQEIRWTGFNSKKVDIELIDCTRAISEIVCPTTAKYVIAENIDNVGYFKWNVGNILRGYSGKFIIGEDSYRIDSQQNPNIIRASDYKLPTSEDNPPVYYKIIVKSTDGREYDESDNYFKIVTSQIGKPTVISPNGGEEWQLGSYQEIRWTGFNSKKVDIELIPLVRCFESSYGIACPGLMPFTIVKDIDNTGYLNWKVGEFIKPDILGYSDYKLRPGDYKIIVKSTDGREYDESDNYFKIVTSQSRYLAPVILGFSGPTKLRVGEKGKWTIEAKDPQGGYLYYRIRWGDESQYANVEEQAASELGGRYLSEQKLEVEHIYSEPGFYNVYVKVTNEYGLSAEANLTVNVTR